MSDEYEYGPWIGWNNGSCGPWPSETVEVVMIGGLGATRREIMKSHDVAWSRGNVIAYRIATPKPKRELVVGKWYRDGRGIWRECIFTDGELAWLRWQGIDTAYVWSLDGCPKDLGPSAAIDWSTPPRDEAPNE